MNENKNKIFEKNKFWSSKTNLMFYSTIRQQANIDNDPINQLIFNFQEIIIINDNKNIKDQNIKAQDIIMFLYFNRNKIEKIIYDIDEVIEIKPNNVIKDLSYYFYLDLLISQNKGIVNYIYTIDFINEINKQRNNIDKKENFKKILISKILVELIINYKGCDYYNEDEDDKSLQIIEKNNKIFIENNIKIFNHLNLNWTIEDLMTKKIDQIYIEIIISLLKDDFNKEKINKMDVINQLDIEKIVITKTIIDELSKELKTNKDYNINVIGDLFDDKKIIFFFNLLKYILKEPLYIFQIEFLLKTRNNIKRIIKKDTKNFLTIFEQKNENIKEKMEYILEFFFEFEYFFLKKYINNKTEQIAVKKQENQLINNPLINNIDNFNSEINYTIINSCIASSNSKGTSTKNSQLSNSSKFFSKESLSDPRKCSNRGFSNLEKLSKSEEMDIKEIKEILEYSSFEFHTDKEKNIEFDTIICGKEKKNKQFEEIEGQRLNLSEGISKIYQQFLSFIFSFKNIIKENFSNNYKLEGVLEFKRVNNQDNDNNDLYDIECIYQFKKPDDNDVKDYHDENCLSNEKDISSLDGFNSFLNDINQDNYNNIDYIE